MSVLPLLAAENNQQHNNTTTLSFDGVGNENETYNNDDDTNKNPNESRNILCGGGRSSLIVNDGSLRQTRIGWIRTKEPI